MCFHILKLKVAQLLLKKRDKCFIITLKVKLYIRMFHFTLALNWNVVSKKMTLSQPLLCPEAMEWVCLSHCPPPLMSPLNSCPPTSLNIKVVQSSILKRMNLWRAHIEPYKWAHAASQGSRFLGWQWGLGGLVSGVVSLVPSLSFLLKGGDDKGTLG